MLDLVTQEQLLQALPVLARAAPPKSGAVRRRGAALHRQRRARPTGSAARPGAGAEPGGSEVRRSHHPHYSEVIRAILLEYSPQPHCSEVIRAACWSIVHNHMQMHISRGETFTPPTLFRGE